MAWRHLSLGYLAVFALFLLSQSIVLAIHGLAAPSLGFLALFVLFSASQSIVLPIHGLALTFYLACGDWDQFMLVLSAGVVLIQEKRQGLSPASTKLIYLPSSRQRVRR